MTYDTYRIIFYASIALAVFCFLLAIALFFLLNVPAVIGDLTGSTERKAIENIRNKNANGTESRYELGQSQKLSDHSRKLDRGHDAGKGMSMGLHTAKFSTQTLSSEAKNSYETTLLTPESNETTVLGSVETSSETTVLSPFENPAANFNAGYNETTVLSLEQVQPAANSYDAMFVIEYEITLIHTEEVIA